MAAIPPPNPNANDSAACLRKQRHDSENTAWTILRKRRARGAERLRVYECSECNGWQLTKMVAV